MAEDRPLPSVAAVQGAPKPAAAATTYDEAYQQLRRLAGMGFQLRAATRAGDRYLIQDSVEDRDTGEWLISCALSLADDITAELDGLARNWKQRPADAGLGQGLTRLRTRAHQLHAATRAADHFLGQDNSEDRGTGSWLVACALGLADKLANETEDLASAVKRASGEHPAAANVPPGDAAGRRPAAAAPPRGATVQTL